MHFAFTVGEECYECCIGGWSNQASVVRKLKKEKLFIFDRNEEEIELLWKGNTPGILSPSAYKNVNIHFLDNKFYFYLDHLLLFQIDNINLDVNSRAYLRGGYGGSVELKNNDQIKRFAGVHGEFAPYYRSYTYYSERYNEYKDHVFLKCDDDIVYMDYKKLKGFIEFRKNRSEYFLVSANVLNNGYCAFLQQQAGHIPKEVGIFELPQGDHIYQETQDIELQPYSLGKVNDSKWHRKLGDFEAQPYGFHGSLWDDGRKAIDLHNYFLSQNAKTLSFPKPIVEWSHYVSINFIAWLGRDLKNMNLILGCDDERALSLDIPYYLNRKHAFYSDFMVSHLSFSNQEDNCDFEDVLYKYEALIK